MKKLLVLALIGGAVIGGMVFSTATVDAQSSASSSSSGQVESNQNQTTTVKGPGYAEGGDAEAIGIGVGGNPTASANTGPVVVGITSKSEYKQQTPPLTTYPPYLPFWTHGGWGILKTYFPNGPSGDERVYQRTFNPDDPADMEDLRKVLTSPSFVGPLEFLAGVWNSISASWFGDPYYPHRGRGFKIANSLIKDRRPEGKPLLVFVDSNIDRNRLEKEYYAYVGKVSIQAEVDRNWDQAYNAVVAEALPWNVDILLVSGGMKGVTVGSNVAFPGAAVGYSQTNYSISLFGAAANGITEGEGKPMVSAEGYRFWPEAIRKRKIPEDIANRIVKPKTEEKQPVITSQSVSNNNLKKAAAGEETSKPIQ